MILYTPPKGTAGFARSRVSGSNREPFPPANITADVFRRRISIICESDNVFIYIVLLIERIKRSSNRVNYSGFDKMGRGVRSGWRKNEGRFPFSIFLRGDC